MNPSLATGLIRNLRVRPTTTTSDDAKNNPIQFGERARHDDGGKKLQSECRLPNGWWCGGGFLDEPKCGIRQTTTTPHDIVILWGALLGTTDVRMVWLTCWFRMLQCTGGDAQCSASLRPGGGGPLVGGFRSGPTERAKLGTKRLVCGKLWENLITAWLMTWGTFLDTFQMVGVVKLKCYYIVK